MNLCIDQGNSSTKIGVFDKGAPVFVSEYLVFSTQIVDALKVDFGIHACIFSTVRKDDEILLQDLSESFDTFFVLTHELPVPIVNEYLTPQTLGKDRLAAIVGAVTLFPDRDILVVDAGTAVTYDLVTSLAVYKGGNIAPGLHMRLKALHEFTGKLPLVELNKAEMRMGIDTRSAIASGVCWGMVYEIEGYVNSLRKDYPQLLVLLTGGSTFYFEGKLKSPIFAEKNLVLIGLDRILQYNVQK